jgi:hypothetical protein
MNPDALEAWNMLTELGRRVYPRPEERRTMKDKTIKARLDEIKATPLERRVVNTLFLTKGKAEAVKFVEMIKHEQRKDGGNELGSIGR